MSETVSYILTSSSGIRYVAHQCDPTPFSQHAYRVRNWGPDPVTVSRPGADTGDPVTIPAGASVDCFLEGTKSLTIVLASGSFAAGTWERLTVATWS